MHEIARVEVLDHYRVDLTFTDGSRGVVDLSDLVGRGVFAAWRDYAEFSKVRVGDAENWSGRGESIFVPMPCISRPPARNRKRRSRS